MAHILLIEDNPIDARLLLRVLSGNVVSQITWLDDGQKALCYLLSLESGAIKERPDLMLLDLHLPKFDGLQVLAEFRKSATAWNLPVYLLSSTPAEEVAELAAICNVRADGYFQKPYGLPQLEDFARHVQELVGGFTPLSSSASRTAAA